MSNVVIKVDDVSKQYRLGKIGTGTLKHDVNRWWHTVRGKEDPYLKIGEVNDRSKKGTRPDEYVWALKDISFEVKQGDVVGIIGKNGAGKSTLLKILSRTTLPTTGSLKIRGRVASLLEVGTGFHPDLTGRENIFLNGAILGMTKSEIRTKFDEIVDFSGIEKYIDTPVKRYSSGMYVRLAFAVAAHLEPEILVVDEVLAVGDAEFQKKALGKMKDVSTGEGRTVLFVSHNIAAIKSLTKKGILLENGNLKLYSDTDSVVQSYMASKKVNISGEWNRSQGLDNPINVNQVQILNHNLEITNELDASQKFYFRIKYEIKDAIKNGVIALIIHSNDEAVLFSTENTDVINFSDKKEPGYFTSLIEVPDFLLNQGDYYIRLSYGQQGVQSYFNSEILNFQLLHIDESKMKGYKSGAYFNPKLAWNTIRN